MKPTIMLGGAECPIYVLDFEQLQDVLPAANRAGMACSIGNLDKDVMMDMGLVIAAGARIPHAEFLKMPIKGYEIAPAFMAVAELAGLRAKSEAAKSGEAVARRGAGKKSMHTSPAL